MQKYEFVKENLRILSNRNGQKKLIMHYLPYSPKFNPIEHRLIFQMTHSLSRVPIYSISDACCRTGNSVTKIGLKDLAKSVDIIYEAKRKVHKSFR